MLIRGGGDIKNGSMQAFRVGFGRTTNENGPFNNAPSNQLHRLFAGFFFVLTFILSAFKARFFAAILKVIKFFRKSPRHHFARVLAVPNRYIYL